MESHVINPKPQEGGSLTLSPQPQGGAFSRDTFLAPLKVDLKLDEALPSSPARIATKLREVTRNHAKSREITRNHAKSREITRNHAKSREITRNHGYGTRNSGTRRETRDAKSREIAESRLEA
ncbi:hypothetical protein T484DRAFT_1749191 [Baffinella frigidus]|nr:hypothetical protein T484DRAFT_1749191 [Cryptophyta sp. CCMP2293]